MVVVHGPDVRLQMLFDVLFVVARQHLIVARHARHIVDRTTECLTAVILLHTVNIKISDMVPTCYSIS